MTADMFVEIIAPEQRHQMQLETMLFCGLASLAI